MRALVICGPTASGKSEIAVRVAAALQAEIINADSRQVYRHMQIGTGWPPPQALATVTHHGFGFLNPDESYSAARFVADARRWIEAASTRGNLPIVVGGTGFYIETLTGRMPLNRPPADDALRQRLRHEAATHPPAVLHGWLATLDRAAAVGVRPSDSYRIVRRLEAILAGRASNPHASIFAHEPSIDFRLVILETSRDVLRERIGVRVREMFAHGLVQEAQHVRAVFPDASALTSLGYAEALAYLDGAATEAEAIALTQRRTLQYAKRQQTWFRRTRNARRIAADDIVAAADAVMQCAREFSAAT